MVLGLAQPPPVVAKPQPRPQLKDDPNVMPEFMWCQRSDRVFVTIKVSDCVGTHVNVTGDGVLEFRGTGHGMCGVRDYALRIQLAAPVIPHECGWFVCGPSVRVRLQKATVGPYWPGLLPRGQKMVQLKVDWASWLDEDEENERSRAPNGFEAKDMQFMMMGESDALYRDPDKFSSSESDEEEAGSVMMDEGLNSLDDMQAKFKALEEEKLAREKTQTARRQLRRKTRDALLAQKQLERDRQHKRPARDLTDEELRLIEGSPTLYDRLKAEKKAEREYWQSKFHHQRRPDKKKVAHVEKQIREEARVAAAEQIAQVSAKGGDAADSATRKAMVKAVYLRCVPMAVGIFGRTELTGDEFRQEEEREGQRAQAKELSRKVAEEEVRRACGEELQEVVLPSQHYQGVWELERKALNLPKAKTSEGVAGAHEEEEEELLLEDQPAVGAQTASGFRGSDGNGDGGDDDDDGGLLLEENPGDAGGSGDDDELLLEENPGEAIGSGGDGDDELLLEENPGEAIGSGDDDDELSLEDNGGGTVV